MNVCSRCGYHVPDGLVSCPVCGCRQFLQSEPSNIQAPDAAQYLPTYGYGAPVQQYPAYGTSPVQYGQQYSPYYGYGDFGQQYPVYGAPQAQADQQGYPYNGYNDPGQPYSAYGSSQSQAGQQGYPYSGYNDPGQPYSAYGSPQSQTGQQGYSYNGYADTKNQLPAPDTMGKSEKVHGPDIYENKNNANTQEKIVYVEKPAKNSSGGGCGCGTILLIIIIVFLIYSCSNSDSNTKSSSYNSYGYGDARPGESVVDYMKREDPEFWGYLEGRWDTLMGY